MNTIDFLSQKDRTQDFSDESAFTSLNVGNFAVVTNIVGLVKAKVTNSEISSTKYVQLTVSVYQDELLFRNLF